jgi:hypothetical protein
MAPAVMLAVLAVPLAGCDLPACESLDLQSTKARASFKADLNPAWLAVGDNDRIEIVPECGSLDQCDVLPVDPPTNFDEFDQLMLTASGHRLIYRVGVKIGIIDIQACEDDGACSEEPVGLDGIYEPELIGTLRGGDWIIYNSDDGLHARYVGDDELELFEEEGRDRDISIDGDLNLQVSALGHRHVVARNPRRDGTEELYLIRVAPALKVDVLGSSMIGEPQLLATGPAFRRIVITEGPSPAERGDPKEFQHAVPTDAQVIATSGEGSEARTLIYDVSNLNQVANFAGEVVTKHAALEDVPGLSAVSPDGSHLAYLTSDGGLALRNLETQRSCLVRSSNAATHLLAGFAADATLYFEAEEEAYVRSDNTGFARQDVENIHTYNPLTETFTALTTPETHPLAKVWKLRAVPPPKRDGGGQPWAVAGYNRDFIVKPDAKAHPLDYIEAQFLPRSNDAGDLWVLEGDGEGELVVRRLTSEGLDEDDSEELSFPHDRGATVCVSSSSSAGWTTPWASRCSSAEDAEGFLFNGPPHEPVPIPNDDP